MAHTKGSARSQQKRVGLDLRGSRQKRGLSLEQIADCTKISIRFLKAIEDEEFDILPGGIFALSYLRQYAAAIGVVEEDLLTRYRKHANIEPEPVVAERASPVKSSLMRFLRAPAETGR